MPRRTNSTAVCEGARSAITSASSSTPSSVDDPSGGARMHIDGAAAPTRLGQFARGGIRAAVSAAGSSGVLAQLAALPTRRGPRVRLPYSHDYPLSQNGVSQHCYGFICGFCSNLLNQMCSFRSKTTHHIYPLGSTFSNKPGLRTQCCQAS